jgi:methylated-DNA-[protein]-cysteine S-methyltransferase
MTMLEAVLRTPAGDLRLESGERALRRLEFLPDDAGRRAAPLGAADLPAALAAAAAALAAHFAGSTAGYGGPIEWDAPAEHVALWERLRRVPFGRYVSYGDLAAEFPALGGPQAVGQVVGANPVAILVPCHRVVGADGALRGYRWGLERKCRLLVHEGLLTSSLPLAEAGPVR